MKLGIMSDLHMEFAAYNFVPEKDVFYICAGDIDSNTMRREMFIENNEHCMFAILGNHDYYGRSFDGAERDFHTRVVNGVKIAGATLWTDLSRGMDWAIFVQCMTDARQIHDITFDEYMNTHYIHKKYLLESGADVIVSHHCPSYASVHQKYRNDALNACFATELSEDILNMAKPPKLWIHGHTHESFDYMIGDTRVICHPRGYPREREHFNTYKPMIIEI